MAKTNKFWNENDEVEFIIWCDSSKDIGTRSKSYLKIYKRVRLMAEIILKKYYHGYNTSYMEEYIDDATTKVFMSSVDKFTRIGKSYSYISTIIKFYFNTTLLNEAGGKLSDIIYDKNYDTSEEIIANNYHYVPSYEESDVITLYAEVCEMLLNKRNYFEKHYDLKITYYLNQIDKMYKNNNLDKRYEIVKERMERHVVHRKRFLFFYTAIMEYLENHRMGVTTTYPLHALIDYVYNRFMEEMPDTTPRQITYIFTQYINTHINILSMFESEDTEKRIYNESEWYALDDMPMSDIDRYQTNTLIRRNKPKYVRKESYLYRNKVKDRVKKNKEIYENNL